MLSILEISKSKHTELLKNLGGDICNKKIKMSNITKNINLINQYLYNTEFKKYAIEYNIVMKSIECFNQDHNNDYYGSVHTARGISTSYYVSKGHPICKHEIIEVSDEYFVCVFHTTYLKNNTVRYFLIDQIYGVYDLLDEITNILDNIKHRKIDKNTFTFKKEFVW